MSLAFKACPFCGSVDYTIQASPDLQTHIFSCKGCPAKISGVSPRELADRWNTRYGSDYRELCKALFTALDGARGALLTDNTCNAFQFIDRILVKHERPES